MDDLVTQLRQKLKWYMYKATIEEYNAQEVNYILEQLQMSDDQYENLIRSCYIKFTVDALQSRKPQKKKGYTHITVAAIAITAIAASITIMVTPYSQAIAGIKNGVFNIIHRDQTGTEMIIEPEHYSNTSKYYSVEELPQDIQGIIWAPTETLKNYTLLYIIPEENRITQYYINESKNDYVEIGYMFNSDGPNYEGKLNMAAQYGDIAVMYYTVTSEDNKIEYIRAFNKDGNSYYIKSNNLEDINVAICEFVEFILK